MVKCNCYQFNSPGNIEVSTINPTDNQVIIGRQKYTWYFVWVTSLDYYSQYATAVETAFNNRNQIDEKKIALIIIYLGEGAKGVKM